MLNWIKKQLNYREKYLGALESSREASANALAVMGRYEYLCANLPYEHELSTRRHWEEYADRRLWSEHQALRRDYSHLRDSHRAMAREWEENIDKYGFAMYAGWKPMKSAPKDGTTILAVWKDDNRITMIEWFSVAGVDGSWSQAVPGLGADHGYNDDAFTHWMPLPEPPKLD